MLEVGSLYALYGGFGFWCSVDRFELWVLSLVSRGCSLQADPRKLILVGVQEAP